MGTTDGWLFDGDPVTGAVCHEDVVGGLLLWVGTWSDVNGLEEEVDLRRLCARLDGVKAVDGEELNTFGLDVEVSLLFFLHVVQRLWEDNGAGR